MFNKQVSARQKGPNTENEVLMKFINSEITLFQIE